MAYKNVNRYYYNQTGKVVCGRGNVIDIEEDDEIISFIDIPCDSTILKDVELWHVENGQVVIDKYIEIVKTPEQIRIEELEDQLLIAEGVI